MTLLKSKTPATSAQDDADVLTSRGVATLLGVSVSTAQLWMESGLLASWKTPGGHRRAHADVVRRFKQTALKRLARKGGTTPQQGAGDLAPEAADAEARRVQALYRSGLLDAGNSAYFDRLTWLAAQLAQAPIALMTLLTPEHQQFKSKHGLLIEATPRAWAFCNYTIAQDDVFTVSDALVDARFCDNPLVVGAPNMRFYAGVPVSDPAGYRLGALCVIDTEPRLLTRQQTRSLRELAAIACREIAHLRAPPADRRAARSDGAGAVTDPETAPVRTVDIDRRR